MRRTSQLVAVVAALLVLTPTAWANKKVRNPADSYPSDVASVWFDKLYDVIKSERTAPPPASRIYGVTAVALYEAIVPGSRENLSLVGQLNGLASVPQHKDNNKKYHWPTVANAVLARTIRGIFTSLTLENLDAINALEASFNAEFQAQVKKNDFDESVAQGQAVADGILAWAATDGFSTVNNCLYVPAPVPGAWVPTPPGSNANPVQPCWGQIRPMVLSSGADCPPAGHPVFSTHSGSEFYAAALEVFNTNLTLTADQKTIADFWADNAGATGTPPGHWIAIVGQLARNGRLSLIVAAEAYARVGIAVTDAFIECWNAKYVYNLERPVTYIQDNIDAMWLPYLVTPNFPTYISGHSTQSGAAATVLTDMFGVVTFTDTIRADHNLVVSV